MSVATLQRNAKDQADTSKSFCSDQDGLSFRPIMCALLFMKDSRDPRSACVDKAVTYAVHKLVELMQ